MKIHKVNIKNLNSLRGDQQIDFLAPPLGQSGLFLICGDTGAGKSTILDAITLALYGCIHRNKDVKEVLSYGATECFAEVEFSAKGIKYRAKWSLWRARGKADGNILGPSRELARWNAESGNFEIIADKIREVDTEVENVSGLDFDRFSRSVLLSQGDFAAFLKANEKDRSDLLERITGTEIYSELSQAAFQKHKIEKDQLDNLQQQQQNLRLLDQEEVKELEQNSKAYSKETLALEKEIKNLGQHLQWWQRKQDLEKKSGSLQALILDLQQQQEKHQADFDALALHLKTQPFAKELSRLEVLQNNIAEGQNELGQIEQLIAQSQEQELADANLLAVAKQHFLEVHKEQTVLGKTLEAVGKLDIEIKEKEQPLQQAEEELQEKKTAIIEGKDRLENLQKERQQYQQQQQEFTSWLASNNLTKLNEVIRQVEVRQRTIDGFVEEGKAKTAELDKEEKLAEQTRKEKEKHQKIIDKKRKELEKLLEDFQQKAPEQFASQPEELLRLLGTEIEILSDQRNNLIQFNEIYQEYQNLLREQIDYEEQLESLRMHELRLNNEVLTSLEMVDAITERLEFKQQIFEQQQLIANYERDRSELLPGTPCPVCQSTDHPFRHKHFKPFLNQARAEYEVVKKQYDDIIKHYRSLLLKQERIAQEIDQLAGNEGRQLGGQVQVQLQKILTYENKIASIIPVLGQNQQIAQNSADHLQRQLSQFDSNLVKKKQLRDFLLAINQKIQTLDQEMKTYEEAQKDRERVLLSQTERVSYIKEQQEKLRQQFLQAEQEINLLLVDFKIQYKHKNAEQLMQDLRKQSEQGEKKQKELIEIEKNIALNKQRIEQQEKQLIDQEDFLSKYQTRITAARAAIEVVQAKRFALLENRDPDAEQKRLQTTLETAQEKIDTALFIRDQTKGRLEEARGQQKEKRKAQQKFMADLEVLATTLLSKVTAAGFAGIEATLQAHLPPEKTATITQLREQLEKEKLQTRQSLQDNEKELEDLLEHIKQQPEQEALLTQQNQLDQRYKELQQTIGAIREKLEHHKKMTTEAESLLQKIEAQRKEFNRWAKLNDLIGSADGKKFRVFAQGLTLSHLCALANKHLQSLDGRYWIEKRSEQDLELNIIDTYQAGNQRSMNTLSGGESFLVSLALALGLSDLAGKSASIESLFIDEGFGTLDDVSLDLAISTLENLQAEGKTIGLISHVKELKERITTQIKIRKQGNGFSVIET